MSLLHLGGLATLTGVRCGGSRAAELDAALRAAWSRCLEPGPHPPRDAPLDDPVEAVDDPVEAVLDAGDDLAGVLQSLTQTITYAKIAAQTGRLFMVHAGAVAAPSGATVAFVAPGGTGKTTIVSRLGIRFGYLTDETVAVDATGRVHPYPKPLSIRHVEGGKVETSPDALGLAMPPTVCTLRRIVLLARTDGHDEAPRVEELSRFDAIAAIAPETSALSSLPRPLHWLDDLLGRLDPTVRLHYRDVETVLDLVAGWLEN